MKPTRLLANLILSALMLISWGELRAEDKAAKSDHWAFQSVKRPVAPAPSDASWVRTPIDAFILKRLDDEHIRPAPPADRRTLLRRVYIDLVGLPPTPEEQRGFLEDSAPDAYERLVDRLLADPGYGERWARHWLDVARYAESNGYERDGAKPQAWRYRDYVINALNQDKPYDRFLREQLAGDEVDGSSAETQIATTFLRLGTWDDEPAEPMMDRYDQLDDVLGTTVTAFMGLTLRCARCHDHKFEPFSQADYYKMLAVFEPLKRPQRDRTDLSRPVGDRREIEAYRTRAVGAALALFGQGIGPGGQLANRLHVPIQLGVLNRQQERDPIQAYVWYEDSPKAPATRIFKRGDPEKPVTEVRPGLPGVLVAKPQAEPTPTTYTTGRRLWLANWLTGPDHPLTARVMVNRLWQHHFGEGLVASENDFGVMGMSPSHPELLDWLASEFVAQGWQLKPLHRLILLSSAYQQAATPNAAANERDPDNTLLWRWRQRRIQAEAFRDSVLASSGQLHGQMLGPSVYPKLPRAVLEGQSRPGEGWGKSDERQANRRSVYIFSKRVLAVPELELLDSPDTTSSCEQRPCSTTGPQALTFLNGEFMHKQAEAMAGRLTREAGARPEDQVHRAFEIVLCRPPRDAELKSALAFLERHEALIAKSDAKDGAGQGSRHRALASFCLVLLNTNEFAYWN